MWALCMPYWSSLCLTRPKPTVHPTAVPQGLKDGQHDWHADPVLSLGHCDCNGYAPGLSLLKVYGWHWEDLDLVTGNPDWILASSGPGSPHEQSQGLNLLCGDRWAGSALHAVPTMPYAQHGPVLSAARTMPSPSLQVPC